jgi:hypothetical protein
MEQNKDQDCNVCSGINGNHDDRCSAAVRGEALAEVLKEARAFIEANSDEVGYGFYRPKNPNDFHPDAESCSAEEIAAHKAACEAYDKGEFMPDNDSGWISPTVHILTAPWGIGSYSYRSPDAQEILAKIDAALSARAADAPSEPSELIGRDCDLLTMKQVNAIRDTIKPGDGWDGDNWDFALANAVAATVKSRAADALDSQPTDCKITYLIKGYPGGWWECGKGSYDKAAEGDRKIIYEKSDPASSQPTDGGVRNGRAELAKLLAGAEPGDAT